MFCPPGSPESHSVTSPRRGHCGHNCVPGRQMYLPHCIHQRATRQWRIGHRHGSSRVARIGHTVAPRLDRRPEGAYYKTPPIRICASLSWLAASLWIESFAACDPVLSVRGPCWPACRTMRSSQGRYVRTRAVVVVGSTFLPQRARMVRVAPVDSVRPPGGRTSQRWRCPHRIGARHPRRTELDARAGRSWRRSHGVGAAAAYEVTPEVARSRG